MRGHKRDRRSLFSLARHYKGDRCYCASFRIMMKSVIRRSQDRRRMQGMSQKFKNKLDICVKGCKGSYTFIICKTLLRMQFIYSCRLLYLSLPVLPLAMPVHFRSISHCNREAPVMLVTQCNVGGWPTMDSISNIGLGLAHNTLWTAPLDIMVIILKAIVIVVFRVICTFAVIGFR